MQSTVLTDVVGVRDHEDLLELDVLGEVAELLQQQPAPVGVLTAEDLIKDEALIGLVRDLL